MPDFSLVSKTAPSADGCPIYAEAIGDPTLPALVFIHGMNSSSTAFDTNFSDPKWLDHAYLIRYDMRGRGRSGKPTASDSREAYGNEKMAEDFLAVIKAFDVQKPPFVAGWSFGASVAADVCAYAGQSALRGVIFVGGLPWVGDVMRRITTPYGLASIPGQLTRDDVALYRTSVQAFVDTIVSPSFEFPYVTRMAWIGMAVCTSPDSGPIGRVQDPAVYVREGVPLPALMIHGAEDRWVDGVKLLEELKPVFGASVKAHFMDSVGHCPFLEAPDEFRQYVIEFIEEVETLALKT